MEIEYIAQEYANLFVRNNDKKKAIDEIIKRIDQLKFDNGENIGNAEKEYIIQLIGEFLSNKRIWKYKYGGLIVSPSAYDNDSFLSLIDYVFSKIKK